MTTVHSTTATQKTVDGPSMKDWRGGRAACGQHHSLVDRRCKGRRQGDSRAERQADRYVDARSDPRRFGCRPDRKRWPSPPSTTRSCAAMKEASEGELKGILGYTEEAVVSSDFLGDARTSIFDKAAGIALNGHLREGRFVVRQRVGLLEQGPHADREDGRLQQQIVVSHPIEKEGTSDGSGFVGKEKCRKE